jgi:hypothetical protein
MNATRLTQRVLLALICCLAIIFLPLSGGAQGILKKGVEGVQKGVETGAEKTKEGAEAVGHGVKEGAEAVGEGAETVGHGVKKAVTGEDTSTTRMKQTEPAQTTAPSEPATRSRTTAPSQATAGETGKKSSSTKHARAGGERLPATAGELPLIALIGVSALAASGTTKLIRRARAVK